MDIKATLSQEFEIKLEYISNIVDLIDEGNTIPFIARYRKEQHGACDDQVIREVADRLAYLQNLIKRKEEVRNSIESQEKWTDELAVALDKAVTLTEVEDIYRPYKQKKKTRASVAIERGLEPLADIIMAQELNEGDITLIASPYVDEEKGVTTADEAVAGAKDIIAERISDDANVRKILRATMYEIGLIDVKLDPKAEKHEKREIYEMYKEFTEKLSALPPHRILAINRGENDSCLKVGINSDVETANNKIKAVFKKESMFASVMDDIIADAYDRLIFPSIEREVRNELTEKASEQAIKMFEVNLKPLLLQPPLKGKRILGLDPAYRTGCKIAVIDENGDVLDSTVVYPTPPTSDAKIAAAKSTLMQLIKKHNVSVISIGNGTASKESEIFVVELIKESGLNIQYMVVNEAGASVYSASKLGAEEFPDLDLTARSAISIARRLQDPLAELIKIDVKSIGVGQYQHDMPQKRLTDVLTGVVEDCVNSVGVDLNTASYSLLSYVAGLNTSIAKNIVKHRKDNPFTTREELLKVAKLGPKAYEQCAGFLRIPGGKNVLDNTSVHPESYEATEKLLSKFGYSDNDINGGKLIDIKDRIKQEGASAVASAVGVGEPTLVDMVEEILKPGRDIRDSLPAPILRDDLMDIKDLKEGMEIIGTVRNVIDFGAFVDIGVHHDGLVHISEISDGYIKHPSDALTVGEVVKVRVIGVDADKHRINLSMRTPGLAKPEKRVKEDKPKRPQNSKPNGGNNGNRNNNFKGNGAKPNNNFKGNNSSRPNNKQAEDNMSLEDKLKALQNKFKR